MTYSLDANACIEGWREFYPYAVFPQVWDGWIDGLFKTGKLIASRSVFDELEVGGDDLFKWAKQRQSAFVHEDDQQVQNHVIAVQRD